MGTKLPCVMKSVKECLGLRSHSNQHQSARLNHATYGIAFALYVTYGGDRNIINRNGNSLATLYQANSLTRKANKPLNGRFTDRIGKRYAENPCSHLRFMKHD